ncbi:MAG: LuxR family transcriptional regulator [Bacillota bacterium]
MADGERICFLNLDERRLSIIVFALFSSWMLAFPFEGRILYAIADNFNYDPYQIVFGVIASHAVGLLFWGFLIKTKKAAKMLMLCSMAFCVMASGIFFYPPSRLWTIALIFSSFMIAASVVSWSFYFKSGTPKNERIKTAADGLIYTNILMILLNMAAIHLAPHIGLGLSMLMLGGAFLFTLLLPVNGEAASLPPSQQPENPASIVKPLAFLCLFIVVITINSGLMYQVVNPAFGHLERLTSWYWAVPYIIALYIMKNLPRKTSRNYILYVAIAMIGLSFVAFMMLDRSALSYLVVNTLMLGAFGVYDLFWWSILGEMLDLNKSPAGVFGTGLSANVLGVLVGGMIGKAVTASGVLPHTSSALALAVVFVSLIILPLLNKRLSILLKNHAYLSMLFEMPPAEQNKLTARIAQFGNLSERESQVANLLLQGKTYRTIAGELYISENTVKFHVRNVYSKFNIQSRTELIDLILDKQDIAQR